MSLIGAALLSSSTVMPDSVAAIGPEGDAFYHHAHKEIWSALSTMFAADEPVDPVTLTEFLKMDGKLDEVGGPVYITELFTAVPSAGNFSQYLEIVKNHWSLRKLIEAATGIISRAYESGAARETASEELLGWAEASVLGVTSRSGASGAVMMRSLMPEVFAMIERWYNNRGAVTGLDTGFRDWNKLTSGLHDGELTILAARPGIGKTSIGMNIVEHLACEASVPCAVFSVEMTKESLALRSICSMSNVDLQKVRSGFLSASDFPAMTEAANRLTQAPIFIDDSSDITAMEIRSRARSMKSKYGVRFVLIDYLQRISEPRVRSSDGREAEVAMIAKQIKSMAKELGLPVLLLAQMNREVEKRGGRPKLSDLRESGAIEQEADTVIFLTRTPDEDEIPSAEAELYFAKQRNGPTGLVRLVFNGSRLRFCDAARVHDGGNAEESRPF